MARIPIAATIFEGFRFAVANAGWIAGAAFLPILGGELANFAYTASDQNLGLAEPGTELGRWIWIPVFAAFIAVVGFCSALASAVVVGRGFSRPENLVTLLSSRRVWRLFSATYLIWGVAYGFIFLFQVAIDLMIGLAFSVNADATVLVMANPWFGAGHWFATTIMMMVVYARMGFFIVPAAMAEGSEVLRRSWQLVHGNLWPVLAVFAAVEGPFLVAYTLLPLPFYGTWGFGTESIFQNGTMVSPPMLDPATEIVKYTIEGILGLAETGVVVGSAIAAYRALSPAHTFD